MEAIQDLILCPVESTWKCQECENEWKTKEKNFYALIMPVSDHTICQKLEDSFQEQQDKNGCCQCCHSQNTAPSSTEGKKTFNSPFPIIKIRCDFTDFHKLFMEQSIDY